MSDSIRMQRRLRQAIVEALGNDTIKALHRPHARPTLLTLLHLWGAVALTFWLAGRVVQAVLAGDLGLPLGLLAWLPLALFMATRINALNVLVHEGSHYSLAANRALNSALTNLAIGYWILFDEDGYRSIHSRHHSDLNEATDPDLPLYRVSPDRRRLVLDFLGDLFWVSVFRRALVYLRGGTPGQGETPGATRGASFDPRRIQHALGKALANTALLAFLTTWLGFPAGPLTYLAFWVVPLLSFYPAIIRVRIITEHFAPEIMDPTAPPVFVARTSVCGPVEHYLFGAQMDFHFEHHLFPAVPYRHLARMHAELERRDFFGAGSPAVVAHSLSGGYFRFWRAFLAGPYFGRNIADVRASS